MTNTSRQRLTQAQTDNLVTDGPTDLEMGDRVPLLGVDEAGKEDGVADEEDRGVVADQVPVAVFGVEFDGKAAGVTSSVGRARLPT